MRWALDGPAAIVPERVAYLLWRKLPLDDFRDQALGTDPELYAVLQAWQGIARSYELAATRRRHEICGSSLAPTPEVTARSPQQLNAAEVADRADITDRAVRLAADQGRLPGTKDQNGAWQFAHHDVARWLAQRRTTSR